MKFGMFGGARSVPGVDDGYHEGYNAYIDAVVEAERLGYYSNFIVEHHFSGLGQVSASLNLLSFLAARTSRIRLGTAVVVLPWHNPVLIAEQAATLDLLSGGRFDFGVGKGYRHNEFDGFRIPIEEATERFEEAMVVIRKAWTANGRFSHNGNYWQYENILVEPSTTQKPHPPLWLAAGRPASLRYAAREGYNLFLDQFQTFEVILERLEIFKQALPAAGRDYDPLGVAVARGLFIARDDAEREAAIAARMKSQEVMNAFAVKADRTSTSSMVSDSDLHKAAVEGLLLGTPEEIIERLKWLEARGVGYVLLSSPMPGGLRIFAEEVMPAFL
ncbi:MAG: LLM class flavin-dependent oxidoreductase [Rhodospirillaceae bacterium]|jgi:alkanesulfonate monooxygenase SsuD/methylene tetrahydromethanopterin reductase-like flavin-dependent oxidoreductase (luciferase family)|nr:LLM class flavin-dependent oxidoreductase [Rhodospirillaceae bacterium]MBT5193869.1 LLM class flavin-dependent oxidoreductase [Rhodospirillaceae bacterium]MBT5897081.1 LLM class flavin-dependent oxidoreductase [Rhodospirillaceae bacterium]MBT6427342.1 LLM class flavin-dependent oxidoreductase [Rhodospirillaceae bacterium]